jgi:hypothetical protein
MITKETVVDQITVVENGIVLYREATRIIEDGKVLTQTYHRPTREGGSDCSSSVDTRGCSSLRSSAVGSTTKSLT